MKTKTKEALAYLKKYHRPFSSSSTYHIDGEHLETVINCLERQAKILPLLQKLKAVDNHAELIDVALQIQKMEV